MIIINANMGQWWNDTGRVKADYEKKNRSQYNLFTTNLT